MELPQLGKQCAFTDCKQLDFLPLPCKCNRVFCTEHFNLHSQDCLLYTKTPEGSPGKIGNLVKCSRPDCEETSLVPLPCKTCNRHFCIKHRHIQCLEKSIEELEQEREKYAAPVREFSKAKIEVDKQVQQALNRSKNKMLVQKVQLMRIKATAKGPKTVPVDQRLYFNITYECKCHPVFVSKTWSVGKAIDSIASELGAVNRNNVLGAKKLVLFKENDILCENLSETVESLLNNGLIVNGQQLAIKYTS